MKHSSTTAAPTQPAAGQPIKRPAPPRSAPAPARRVVPPQPKDVAAESPTSNAAPRSPIRWRVLRGVPSWMASMIVHVIIVLILALLTFAPRIAVPETEIFSLQPDAETEPELLDAVVEVQPLEEMPEVTSEVPSLAPEAVDPGAAALGDVSSVAAVADVEQFSASNPSEDIGALFGSEGIGLAEVGDGAQGTQFFGMQSPGRRFVFVVDNSNSMTGGRFETAIYELYEAVRRMQPPQQFYVIFYSDTSYSLFHPQPASTLITASETNKERLRQWLSTVQLCLKTNGAEAMQRAVALDPDVIYLLGDGAFTDQTEKLMTGPLKGKTVVHTLGMNVKPEDRREFAAIAKANNGTFRDVGVSPDAARLAAQRKIPRNTTRGPVWGLKLPLKSNKK